MNWIWARSVMKKTIETRSVAPQWREENIDIQIEVAQCDDQNIE